MLKSPRLPLWQQLSQRLEAMPQLKTEDSLAFRILVQALVIVGIIATDVAAQTQMSVWAVPLSIAGASWSWYRRKQRNVTVKFLLAIAMLAVLVVFLSNLVVNLNDSQLALAGLLIQLQVLHSFDLPRRKDLGYSMMIGLILLGVAGMLSQTLAFAPWLLLFLAIALPALVLDYRSRLGLDSLDRAFRSSLSQRRLPSFANSPLSPKRLGLFLLLILVLGLAIFALMPRFSGYQLQNFPVGSPAELDNQEFTPQNSNIVNPGYVKPGQNGKGGGTGIGANPETGKGRVDSTFYYGFNRKMNQNLRGEMKPQVVMRVRSQASGFWQVMSFDRYTGQGWEVSRDGQLANIKRPSWSYRFFVAPPATIAPTKEVIQSYTMVSSLPNLIPALPYPKYLFFPTKEVGIDPEGSLRAPSILMEGLTYTVISEVPYRDRSLLRAASEDYSRSIQQHYLQIPPEIAAKVRNKAEQLLAKSPKPLTSAYEKALFLAQTLKQTYSIQPDFPFLEDQEDLVEAFLFRYEGGYPDHFSTALTVMLRSLGIPARLSVGFAPGQFNPFTGYYVVRNTDAYALTEVYFPNYGWFAFDPIPGHELIPPSFEEDQTFSVLKQFWQWVAGWLPSPVVNFLSILWAETIGGLSRAIAWLWQFISGSAIGVLTGLMGAITFSFLGWLGFGRVRRWGYRRRLAKLPPVERLYQQMLEVLRSQGYPKHPAQTPLEYARVAQQHHPQRAAEIIEEISQAYVRWRYGQQTQNIDYLRQQLRRLARLKRNIKIKKTIT
jgi:transglutaminase-like putative cysteine protease